MDLVRTAAGRREGILVADFNQDYSCIALGTQSGYSITNCEPWGQVHAKELGPTCLVSMLFSTSLVAVVVRSPAGGEKRLHILNTKRNSTICELTFPADIRAVRMNRRRLVVALATALYVYDISNMKLLHTIETGMNTTGLCVLAPASDECYMAYAAHEAGDSHVVVYNLHTLAMVHVIPAHRSRVACLAFNAAGTVLATASEKGTVIRLFSVPSGRLLHQFRRGTYPARIFRMSFNVAGTILCVTSDSDTVHLFRVPAWTTPCDPNQALAQKKRRAWRSTSMAQTLGTYLPSSVTEMWEPTRDFAWLKLPRPGLRAIAVVSNTLPVVLVLTYEGILYTYTLDLELGGECQLAQRMYDYDSHAGHSLLSASSASP